MNTLIYADNLLRAAEYIKTRFQELGSSFPAIRWGIILGSGLGGLGDHLAPPNLTIPYADIPGFPQSTVSGHAGNLIIGRIGSTGVAVMEGRFHLYEGYSAATVVLPVRVMITLGIDTFFLTNAAGGIRNNLSAGDLMMIDDHINLMGTNPLIGPNMDQFGVRFPAMKNCYDPNLRQTIAGIAAEMEIPLKSGIYAALSGPTYETVAEITMLSRLGADAVGMSTVPEVIAIRHAGKRVVAVSLITNITWSDHIPTHQEVVEMGQLRRENLHQVILRTIQTTAQK